VTAQHLATDVGVRVLKRGRNAVDAAVALGYAPTVVYPAAGNLGGGGFMTAQMGDGRKFFIGSCVGVLVQATADYRLDPATAAIFLNAGEPFAVGQKLVQKDLPKALSAVSRNGADGFYKGPIASAIAASNGQRNNNGLASGY
jgi:gamma-glutamyltranspeptidase